MSPHDEFPPAMKAVMVAAYIAIMGALSWFMHERFGPWFHEAASGWPFWLNVLFVAAIFPISFVVLRRHFRERRESDYWAKHWAERRAEKAAGITVLPPPPKLRLP